MGTLWVTVQFFLIVLLWHCSRLSFPLSRAALVCGAAGVVLGGWVLRHNPPGNFRIHPEPHRSGHLITSGPYRWLRHPMYSTLLLLALALILQTGNARCALLGLLLWGVLYAKSRLEERLLVERWPAYEAYQKRTWRFLPWLW